VLPCVIFEDSELLAINKPAGLNTHAPSPYAGEGIYDWLRHREPRWADLAIIHRLDKETSGIILFSKTSLANRSFTNQFTEHAVGKRYVFLTDRPLLSAEIIARSCLLRTGDKYFSRPVHPGGAIAETKFRALSRTLAGELGLYFQQIDSGVTAGKVPNAILAEPLTGRTHQIRVHAAEKGFPVLGDTLYRGTPASRLYLHAAELRFKHPLSGEEMFIRAPADFAANAGWLLRTALMEPESTNTYRLIHGASDRWPGWFVDRLGNFLLSSGNQKLTTAQEGELKRLMKMCRGRSSPQDSDAANARFNPNGRQPSTPVRRSSAG